MGKHRDERERVDRCLCGRLHPCPLHSLEAIAETNSPTSTPQLTLPGLR